MAKVRCYYCGHDYEEEELIKKYVEEFDMEKEYCPNCGKDVFYDLKEIDGQLCTFATRV